MDPLSKLLLNSENSHMVNFRSIRINRMYVLPLLKMRSECFCHIAVLGSFRISINTSLLLQNCRQTGEAGRQASMAWGCFSLIHTMWSLPYSPQLPLFCPENPIETLAPSLRKSTLPATAS
jgi:hypothetical protein